MKDYYYCHIMYELNLKDVSNVSMVTLSTPIYGCLNIQNHKSEENITVIGSLTGGRSTKNNGISYDTPKLCLFSIVL